MKNILKRLLVIVNVPTFKNISPLTFLLQASFTHPPYIFHRQNKDKVMLGVYSQ